MRPRTAYTAAQAGRWRAEYDRDDTLRVADMAVRHHVKESTMRSALLWSGGALRSGAITRTNRQQARNKTPGTPRTQPVTHDMALARSAEDSLCDETGISCEN